MENLVDQSFHLLGFFPLVCDLDIFLLLLPLRQLVHGLKRLSNSSTLACGRGSVNLGVYLSLFLIASSLPSLLALLGCRTLIVSVFDGLVFLSGSGELGSGSFLTINRDKGRQRFLFLEIHRIKNTELS